MIVVDNITSTIERIAPPSLQESYDNCGLQVGLPDTLVTGVLTCLDVTAEIIDEAVAKGCNMIVSHHPLIFKGLKHLTGASVAERLVAKAILSGVAIYSAHTSLDRAENGLNAAMAERLGLKYTHVLEAYDKPEGLGRIGSIDEPMTTDDFLRHVKEAFGCATVRYGSEYKGKLIEHVAVCGGAGASLIPLAIEAKMQAFVTGDLKYHDFTTYADKILLVDIGHFESELCGVDVLTTALSDEYPGLKVVRSSAEHNPISYI